MNRSRQGVDDLNRVKLSFHPDREAFSAVFIQDVECPERPAIIGSVMHKVVRPDMIAILRTQTDARSIIQPEPPFLWLSHWHFKPLASPKTFDTLVIHSASPRLSARPRLGDSHIDRTGASTRSCLRPSVLRQHGLWAIDVVWIDVGPNAAHSTLRNLQLTAHDDQCRHGDAKGSEVSRCSLL